MGGLRIRLDGMRLLVFRIRQVRLPRLFVEAAKNQMNQVALFATGRTISDDSQLLARVVARIVDAVHPSETETC